MHKLKYSNFKPHCPYLVSSVVGFHQSFNCFLSKAPSRSLGALRIDVLPDEEKLLLHLRI